MPGEKGTERNVCSELLCEEDGGDLAVNLLSSLRVESLWCGPCSYCMHNFQFVGGCCGAVVEFQAAMLAGFL